MAHPYHCGKVCSECIKVCGLDESIHCSPDCEGLNPITGEPDSEECKTCDAINDSEAIFYI